MEQKILSTLKFKDTPDTHYILTDRSAQTSVSDLSGIISSHITNNDIHINSTDKQTWNNKQDKITYNSNNFKTISAGSNVTLDITSNNLSITAKDTVTTVSPNGTGNVITNITDNNGALTMYKSSVQEIISAYNASNISLGTFQKIKAGSNITLNITDNTLNITAASGSAGSTYTPGDGISISNYVISNAGVRSIASGTVHGTISVNTNGTTTDIQVNPFDKLFAEDPDGTNKNINTKPNDYNKSFIFKGLKTQTAISLPGFSYLLGLRGYVDATSGNAHEFAFNNSGIYYRTGATTDWNNWDKIATTTETSGIASGIASDFIQKHNNDSNAHSNKVTGPESSNNNTVAIFNGTTGKLIKDSTFTIEKSVPVTAVFTDTITTIDSTIGDGNVITNITASNGALTVTKGITALTSHQSLDGKQDVVSGYNASNTYLGTFNKIKAGSNVTLSINSNILDISATDLDTKYNGISGITIDNTNKNIYINLNQANFYNGQNQLVKTENTGKIPASIYTDTVTTIASTTGDGNVITNITANNGILTITKDFTASPSNHTHNYAESTSAGGAATSANKLNTNAGSTTQPVYFDNGIPVSCTFTVAKSVPSDAKFTDTVTTIASTTGDGNVITNIVASNGALTITKGITALTSFTQSDPVFKSVSADFVKGPASVTTNRVAAFDGTTGKLIKDSGYTVSNLPYLPINGGTLTGATYITTTIDSTSRNNHLANTKFVGAAASSIVSAAVTPINSILNGMISVGVSGAIRIENGNANDSNYSQGYYFFFGNTSNLPYSNATGFLTSISDGNNNVSQLFHTYNQNRLFTRIKQNTTWKSWQQVVLQPVPKNKGTVSGTWYIGNILQYGTLSGNVTLQCTTSICTVGKVITLMVTNTNGGTLTFGSTLIISTNDTGSYLVTLTNINGTVKVVGERVQLLN